MPAAPSYILLYAEGAVPFQEIDTFLDERHKDEAHIRQVVMYIVPSRLERSYPVTFIRIIAAPYLAICV